MEIFSFFEIIKKIYVNLGLKSFLIYIFVWIYDRFYKLLRCVNLFFFSTYSQTFEVFPQFPRQKMDFAHRSGALARPGSRELRAVKIPASYDAWRPPKRRKNDSGKNRCFWVSEISFRHFPWILEGIDNFKRQNQFPPENLLQIHLF